MELLLTIAGIVGLAVAVHKLFNKTDINSVGNHVKPRHQRVVKRTN